jgi:hypothetical protein
VSCFRHTATAACVENAPPTESDSYVSRFTAQRYAPAVRSSTGGRFEPRTHVILELGLLVRRQDSRHLFLRRRIERVPRPALQHIPARREVRLGRDRRRVLKADVVEARLLGKPKEVALVEVQQRVLIWPLPLRP